MSRLIQLKPHPFRLLLYVEWILLGLAVVSELPWDGIPYIGKLLGNAPIAEKLIPFSTLLTLICIVIFGLTGLLLPTTDKVIGKLLYTILELTLIWLASALGSWQQQFLFLYLIVIIRSCLIFERTGRLLIAGLVFVSFLLTLLISVQDIQTIQYYFPALKRAEPEQVRFLVLFLTVNSAFFFGLVLLLVSTLLSERQHRQKLAIAHDQLRQYALRIEDQATLQERNRIAREIHDALGHALTAQSIQLENALLFCPPRAEKTQAFLTAAKQLGAKALKEVRQSVAALRHHPLRGQALESVITNLVQDFHHLTNIIPDCTIDFSHPVTAELSTAIYRIAQEALINIYKHSGATEVKIRLQAKKGLLHLLIADNGRGFHPAQNTTGFGLQGMRERTAALGGWFEISSGPGQGCRVNVEIPLVSPAP